VKAWVTATFDGRCAYDGTHTWQTGARVFSVQGVDWTRPKIYCPDCAVSRHGAKPDTGEVVEPGRVLPFAPLKALAQAAGQRFDVKQAAAGERE
jgi:hypothetical protein